LLALQRVVNHTQVNQLAYNKYLKEVVSVLLTDKEFTKKVLEAGSIFSEKVMTFLAVFMHS